MSKLVTVCKIEKGTIPSIPWGYDGSQVHFADFDLFLSKANGDVEVAYSMIKYWVNDCADKDERPQTKGWWIATVKVGHVDYFKAYAEGGMIAELLASGDLKSYVLSEKDTMFEKSNKRIIIPNNDAYPVLGCERNYDEIKNMLESKSKNKKSITEKNYNIKYAIEYMDSIYKNLERDMKKGLVDSNTYVKVFELLQGCDITDDDLNYSADRLDDLIYQINEYEDTYSYLIPFVKDFESFRDNFYAMASLNENKSHKKSLREEYKHSASVDLADKLYKSYMGKLKFNVEWDKLVAKYIVDEHIHGFATDILDVLENLELKSNVYNLMDLAYLLEDDMEVKEMKELSDIMGEGK